MPGAVAYRLGIHSCVVVGTMHTANGDAGYCSVVVSRLSFAGFDFFDVAVSVLPNMTGDIPLLGGDLLKQLDVVQKGNVMTLSR